MTLLRFVNLALLILFPVSWFTPLARAGLLPFFNLDEISVISGVLSLWEKDVLLALLVAFFAMVAPVVKTLALAAVQFRLLKARALPLIEIIGKLAMADVFLIAIYVMMAKGIGVGRIEIGWGLYFFTALVLVSMAVTHMSKSRS